MKKLKKFASLLLAVSMILSLVACGNSSSNSTSANAGSEVAFQEISLASGGTSGTYYGFSNVIAQRLNEVLIDKMNISVVSTGASKANAYMVNDGDAQIAILQNDVMSYAYNGTDMFEGEKPIQTFSAIASMYPEAIQIIANKSINSIEELKGKRVSVGDSGSGTEFNAKQILGIYGIDMNTDIVKGNQSFADSCNALKNGTLDAAFITAGHPTVAVTELATNFDFNILSIDDEHANQLIQQYGFYAKVNIEKDSYTVLNDDVKTVAVMATFIASNNLSEDAVYTFTKALFDEKAAIASNHQKGQLIDINTAISGISIPYHKGAEKYYKEIGALK